MSNYPDGFRPAMLFVTPHIGFYIYMSKMTKTTSGSSWIARNKKKKGEEALLSRLSGAQENKRHQTVT